MPQALRIHFTDIVLSQHRKQLCFLIKHVWKITFLELGLEISALKEEEEAEVKFKERNKVFFAWCDFLKFLGDISV